MGNRTQSYIGRFLAGIKSAAAASNGVLTQAQVDAIFRTSRAGAGGDTRAQNRKVAPDATKKVAAADLEVMLADEVAFEDVKDKLNQALKKRYGTGYWTWIRLTYPDTPITTGKIIYQLETRSPGYDETGFSWWQADYTVDEENNTVDFANAVEVVETRKFEPMKAGLEDLDERPITLMYGVPGKTKGKALPAHVAKMSAKDQRRWAEIWNNSYQSCTKKGNSNCEAVAFRNANGVVAAEDADDYCSVSLAEYGDTSGPSIRIKLDEDDTLPDWAQLHFIGEHEVEHGSGIQIKFDAAMGDQMIRNFRNNVLERKVPLDARHKTDQDGIALAICQELSWGTDDAVVPGQYEHAEGMTHVWARWKYNKLGTEMLLDDQLLYTSPQYWLDYVRKKDGKHFGVVLSAAAATNNPFLRMKSLKGEPVPVSTDEQDIAADDGDTEFILLEDVMGDETTPKITLAEWQSMQSKLADAEKRDAARAKEIEDLKAQNHRTRVDALLSDLTTKGVAPAITKKARAILVETDSGHEALVALDDSKPDEKVNLYGAISALLQDFAINAHLLSGGVTSPDVGTQLPANTPQTGRNATLDDQVLGQATDFLSEIAGIHRNGKDNRPAEM